MEQMGFLGVFIAFVIGVIVTYFSLMHQNKVDQMDQEDYQKCVSAIVTESDSLEQARTLIAELHVYMGDINNDLLGLSSELEAIVRRVTDEWD